MLYHNVRRLTGLVLLGFCTLSIVPAVAETLVFDLEETRSGRLFGPYPLREGAEIVLQSRSWRLHLLSETQVVFEQADGRLREGPYTLTQGRIITIGEQAFTIVNVRPQIPPARPPPKPAVPGDRSLPGATEGWRDLVGNLGGLSRGERMAALKFEPWRRILMEWELGGLAGDEGANLEERVIGVRLDWRGWSFVWDGVLDAEVPDSPVPTGIELAAIDIENGSGWGLAAGYGRDLVREANWRFGVSAHVAFLQRSFDLSTTRLMADSVSETNGVQSVHYIYRETTEPMTLREWGIHAGPDLRAQYGDWGAEVQVSLLLFSDLRTDARVATSAGRFRLKAKRRHPVSGSLSLWRDIGAVRLQTAGAAGGENRIELSVGWRW